MSNGERRHWVQTETFDLIVFENTDGVFDGFHLSYDKRATERLVEWNEGASRMSHFRVDPQHGATGPDMTPTLTAIDAPIPRDLSERLRDELGTRASRVHVDRVLSLLDGACGSNPESPSEDDSP